MDGQAREGTDCLAGWTREDSSNRLRDSPEPYRWPVGVQGRVEAHRWVSGDREGQRLVIEALGRIGPAAQRPGSGQRRARRLG